MRSDPRRKIIIALDPGHGGEDPVQSVSGTQEKHVVLAIGKLKAMIDAEPGMRAMLTRDSDYYVRSRRDVPKRSRYRRICFSRSR